MSLSLPFESSLNLSLNALQCADPIVCAPGQENCSCYLQMLPLLFLNVLKKTAKWIIYNSSFSEMADL